MNGFALSDFADFHKKWQFVTVRFRKDTEEMRFTYANDLAWKALQEKKTEYPDGAVFAKIGIATQMDLNFPSSAVPSGARRVQFMVRDKKKFKETDGWGYVLFDANGLTFPEDPNLTSHACAACHRLVTDRGFIFSQMINESVFDKSTLFVTPKAKKSMSEDLKFSTVATSTLPSILKEIIPPQHKTVRTLKGELQKNLFQGTLDEIKPLLAQESMRAQMPAILLSHDQKRFSLVFAIENGSCRQDQSNMVGISNIYFEKDKKNVIVHFCGP